MLKTSIRDKVKRLQSCHCEPRQGRSNPPVAGKKGQCGDCLPLWGTGQSLRSFAMTPGTCPELRLKHLKIIVEKHPDGYVAYPLGLKGVVVGEGDTYDEALADVKSAIQFHIETFGTEVLEVETPE